MSETEIHGDGSEMTIEQTNALRIQLGLSPLEEEKKEDFVHKPALNIGEKKYEEKKRSKLVKHHEEREMFKKLKEYKPLSEDMVSLPNFDRLAEKAKERRKKEEIGSSSEDEECDNRPLYTGNDLEGLPVAHSSSRFGYQPMILTLQDSNILDIDNGDVLVNVNIAEQERYEQNVKNKKLGVNYNPQSDDEEDLVRDETPALLEKYDDEKKKQFFIGPSGKYDSNISNKYENLQPKFIGTKISLPEKEVKIANDYYTTDEMMAKLKMKRKRKARATRTNTKVATIKVESVAEDVKPKKEEGELEEDNNLKSKKSKSTIEASAKKVITTVESEEDESIDRPTLTFTELPTMVNTMLRSQLSSVKRSQPKIRKLEDFMTFEDSDEERDPKSLNIYMSKSIDNTDEVYRKLKAQQEYNAARVARNVKEEPLILPVPASVPEASTSASTAVKGTMESMDVDEPAHSSGWQPEDKIMPAPKSEKKKQTKPVQPQNGDMPKKVMKLTDGVLGGEVQLNKGLYTTLLLASKKGYIDQPRQETLLSNPRSNDIRAQNFHEEKIRYEDIDSKAPRRERYTGPVYPLPEKKDYKPDIKLEYNDEHGRVQEPKEAFRTLSHRFHGKSSGKIKCEKRDSRYKKEVTSGALVGDVAMRSVDKQYSKMKEEKKFCVALSGKNAIIPSSLKKIEKKSERKGPVTTDKASPK